ALENYREAERIGEQWLAANPGGQELRRQLAEIEIAAAEVLRIRGENQAAGQENAKALELLTAAAAANPADRGLESALAAAYLAAGASEVRLGRLQEGLGRYREAQTRMDRLNQLDPSDARYQHSLMQAYTRV